MDELISQYLEAQKSKGIASSTLKTYSRAILYFFKFCSQHQEEMYLPQTWSVQDIGIRELEFFLREHLFQRSWKEDTLVTYMSALRSFYHFLLEIHKIESYPFAHFTLKRHLKEIQISQISRDAMQQIFDSPFSDTFEGRRNRLLLELAYGLAIPLKQLSLMTQITWDTDQSIYIHFEEKKTLFPLGSEAMSLLRMYLHEQEQDDSKIFWKHKNGKPLKLKDIEKILKKILSPIEILAQKPALLRELSAQHFSESGGDFRSLQQFREVKYLRRMQSFKKQSFADLQKRFKQSHPHEK